MPDLSIIQTASWWVFGTLLAAIISANVRRRASDKGHDGYLLSIWNMLPEWVVSQFKDGGENARSGRSSAKKSTFS
jgi:hypothetical protein